MLRSKQQVADIRILDRRVFPALIGVYLCRKLQQLHDSFFAVKTSAAVPQPGVALPQISKDTSHSLICLKAALTRCQDCDPRADFNRELQDALENAHIAAGAGIRLDLEREYSVLRHLECDLQPASKVSHDRWNHGQC